MVADASIYGLLRQPQPMADPMEQFGRAMTIKNLMGQGRMQDMQMAEAQRAVEEEGRIRDLFSSGRATPEAIMAISPKRGIEFQKSQLEIDAKKTEAAAKRMEILSKGVGMLKDRLPTVRDDASYQAYRETAASLLGPDMVAKLNLPASYDPNWVRNQVVKAEELFTPKPKEITRPDGSIVVVDSNPWTNPQIVGTEFAAAMTPSQKDASQRGWAQVNQPVWDSERGVFVARPQQGPRMGGSVMAQAPAGQPAPAVPPASPSAAPAVVTPNNLPPRASDAKLTEAQGNATAFGLRASESHKILNELEDAGTYDTGVVRSAVSGAAGIVPFVGEKLDEAVSSTMNTFPEWLGGPDEQEQRTEQARRDFVNAVLRKESGAVINREEFANASRQYFPQPGDTKAVIEQKRKNRETAIKALTVQAGPGAKHIPPPPAPGGIDPSKLSDDELRRELGL